MSWVAVPLLERVLDSEPPGAQKHWARAGLATAGARRGTDTHDAMAEARAWFSAFPDSRAHELERMDALGD